MTIVFFTTALYAKYEAVLKIPTNPSNIYAYVYELIVAKSKPNSL